MTTLSALELYLQLPDALLVVLVNGGVRRLGCSDHLSPPHSLLQLHEPLFVLVPLHQHSRHLYPGEPLPLSHRHLLLIVRLLLLPTTFLHLFLHLLQFLLLLRHLLLQPGPHSLEGLDLLPQYLVFPD